MTRFHNLEQISQFRPSFTILVDSDNADNTNNADNADDANNTDNADNANNTDSADIVENADNP